MKKYLILFFGIVISCANNDSNKEIICQGLPQNAQEYYKTIKFPMYSIDSLNNENFADENYLDFKNCDDSIFKNNRNDTHYKYISLQDTSNFITLIAYHQCDGENYIGLYTINRFFHPINSEVLFHPYGIGINPPSDFNYNDSIINYHKETKILYHHLDQYKVVITEYYRVKDSIGIDNIDKGKQIVKIFRINQNGQIKKIEDKTFEKPYVTALWSSI